MPKRIRVLVVDDSAAMRQLLTDILRSDSEIEVVGSAADAYAARDMIKSLNPDVLTLDVEMPRMNGLSFLRNLMRLRPMPVVMCSALTQAGATVALDALAMGAIDFVAKPVIDMEQGLKAARNEILYKVKMAATAHVRPSIKVTQPNTATQLDAGKLARRGAATVGSSNTIIALGASTGGTEALKQILTQLPADVPAVVVAQHIPKAFSGAFASRMNSLCALDVCEACDGQQIVAGRVYIAPGDQHLLVARDGANYYCRLSEQPPVNRHRPSVDVLFRSVAQTAGRRSVGVLLTGMGRDGAEGLQEMRQAGAATLAQDEASSVIWGMPGAAWALGAAQSLHPLDEMAGRITALARPNATQGLNRRQGRNLPLKGSGNRPLPDR